MGDVGSARYEPALLPPCPTTRVLSYSNCVHPLTPAVHYLLVRAYQGLVWRAGDKTAPPEFTANQLLSSFSWKMEEDILVPNHDCADIAPKSLL